MGNKTAVKKLIINIISIYFEGGFIGRNRGKKFSFLSKSLLKNRPLGRGLAMVRDLYLYPKI